jgi:hypothetical protein
VERKREPSNYRIICIRNEKFATETNFKPISEAEAKKTQGRKIMHFDTYRDAMNISNPEQLPEKLRLVKKAASKTG